jgi:hypothetical protein
VSDSGYQHEVQIIVQPIKPADRVIGYSLSVLMTTPNQPFDWSTLTSTNKPSPQTVALMNNLLANLAFVELHTAYIIAPSNLEDNVKSIVAHLDSDVLEKKRQHHESMQKLLQSKPAK